jgi:hypothetical protein
MLTRAEFLRGASFLVIGAGLTSAAAQLASSGHGSIFAPEDFFAPSMTDDTRAVQMAIDNACSAGGGRVVLRGRAYMVSELRGADGIAIEGVAGTVIRRIPNAAPPANPSRALLDFSGFKGWRVSDLVIDGAGADQTNAAQNFAAVGCGDFSIERIRSTNPLAVGGSYGAALVVADTTDSADGTRSRIGDIELEGGGVGTYGLYLVRVSRMDIGAVKGRGFINSLLAIADTTLPVPDAPTNHDITIASVSAADCGIGIEIFGFRSGVDAVGKDVFAPRYVTADVRIERIEVTACRAYGAALQGLRITVRDCVVTGCGTPGQLFGGILFTSTGSRIANAVVESPAGIGFDGGGSTSCVVAHLVVRPGPHTDIAINAGASIDLTIASGTVEAGATQGVLASGFDGADSTNWIPWRGRNLTLRAMDITVGRAGDTGLRVSNAFDGVVCENVTFHMRATGRAANYAGGENIARGGIRVVDESWKDRARWSDVQIVAAAATVTLPDAGQDFSISGSSRIDTLQRQEDAELGGAVAAIVGLDGAVGSGYSDASALVIGGDGRGATAVPVVSAGGLYGGYVTEVGQGYSVPPAVTTRAGGRGAELVARIGPAVPVNDVIQLTFEDDCSISGENGNIRLQRSGGAETCSRLSVERRLSEFVEISR